MSIRLMNFITYHNLNIEIKDEVSELFGQMVGALAWELMSGREDTDEKFIPIKIKFQEIVEKYELDEDIYDEFTNLLLVTYKEFAENIIKQEKDRNGELVGLEAALSKLNF